MSKVEEPAATSSAGAGSGTPAVKLLARYTVDDFPFARKVVTLDAKAGVQQAFETLAKNGISSAPVRGASGWVGFVDIADLVAHVAELHRLTTGSPGSQLPTYFTSLRNLLARASRLIPKPVTTAVNLSKNNPFVPVAPGTSLLEVFRMLGTKHGEANLHRVPVVDPKTGDITKIISQSAAIAFLYAHLESLGPVAAQTLDELGLARKPVCTIAASDPALLAFERMAEHKLSGLAVVGDDGRIVCSISAADVRFLVRMDKFQLVGMDVLTLVSTCRQMDTARMGKTMAPLIVVTTATQLGMTLAKLGATRVHRLYIIDSSGALVGVVSLKDILRRLFVAA